MSPWRGSSEVRATRMKCVASAAPVMNHLRPVTTIGCRRASRRGSAIIDGSEPPPGCGSVMAKAERTSPSTIGCQPALLLLRRADRLEHHHVAVVGRRRVEHDGPEDRAVHRLVADRHARPVEPRPAASRASAAGTTGPPPAPWRARPREGRGGCSRAGRRQSGSASSGSSSRSTKAAMRARKSSTRGGMVKSMASPQSDETR